MNIRIVLRSLLQSPIYALSTVISLGLSIALNTTMFGVVEAVLLRPLPYRQPELLHGIQDPRGGSESTFLSYPEYLEIRDQNRSFEEIAAYRAGFAGRRALRMDSNSGQVHGFAVSGNLFQVLGVSAILGRTLLPEDEQLTVERPMVLSHRIWQRSFGGRADVLDTPVRMDGRTYRVVGVMPQGFWFPFEESQFWVPLNAPPLGAAPEDYSLSLVGRLRPGITLEESAAETRVLIERLNERRTEPNLYRPAYLVSLDVARRPSDATFFYVFLGVTLCILLVSCANISALALTRAIGRARDTAIQVAIGASTRHLLGPLLTESIILVAAATVIGTFLSWAGLQLLVAALPLTPLHSLVTGLNVRILLFALGLGGMTVLLCTFAPMVQTGRTDASLVLKEQSATSAGPSGYRLRGALVVAQIALSITLLTSTGLLVRGLVEVSAWNPGFDSRNLFTMMLDPSGKEEAGARSDPQVLKRLQERLSVHPQVERLAFSSPLKDGWVTTDDGARAQCKCLLVTPGYMQTMRIDLKRGRYFSEVDVQEGGAVIVDERLTEKLWEGKDPVGALVRLGNDEAAGPLVPVVGVVEHVDFSRPSLDGSNEQLPSPLYFVGHPGPPSPITLAVRTSPDAQVLPSLRRAMLEVDPDLPVYELQPATAALDAYVNPLRWYVGLFATFALLAFLLAMIGLYSVVSYGVHQRRRELGIRIALGAQPRDLVPMVLSGAARLVLVGTVIGLVGSIFGGKVAASLLAGIRATDLLILTSIVGVLFATAIVACLPPIFRALAADPMKAIRSA